MSLRNAKSPSLGSTPAAAGPFLAGCNHCLLADCLLGRHNNGLRFKDKLAFKAIRGSMQDFTPEVLGRSKLFKSLAAVILALPVLLVGCSSVPDWADPTDWFDDESPTPQTANASGDEGAIPPLASVPDETRSISSAEERAADVEGLQADQSASRYSDESLTAQTVVTSVAPQPESAGSGMSAATAGDTSAAQVAASSGTGAAATTAMPAVPSADTSGAAPRATTFAPSDSALPRPERLEIAAVIYFAHSSTALDRNDLAVLADVAALQRQRGAGLKIVGHASSRTAVASETEHQIANFNVSLTRADKVRNALVRRGVPAAMITTEAVGDAQPVYHEFMPTGEAGNRRVEVYLVY
jgi:outer membrane protein OmpA-like peptidoglycan-associated protein